MAAILLLPWCGPMPTPHRKTLDVFFSYVDPDAATPRSAAAFGDLSSVAIPMFGEDDPGEVNTDAVRAVAGRRLQRHGSGHRGRRRLVGQLAAPEWVFASDADGRWRSWRKTQMVPRSGPVLAGGLSHPPSYLGGQTSRNLEPVGPPSTAATDGIALRRGPWPPGPPAGPVDFHDMEPGREKDHPRKIQSASFGGVMLPAMSIKSQTPQLCQQYEGRSGAPARISTWWSTCNTGASGTATDAKQLFDDERGELLGLYEVFVLFTRRPLWFMIFGGVFDRHPKLKVVVTENGVQWLPSPRPGHGVASTPMGAHECAPTSTTE